MLPGLLLVFGTGFAVTFFLAPFFIRKLKEAGYVVNDMYKPDQPLVPSLGGLIILSGVMASLITAEILFHGLGERLLIFYFMVLGYAFFGLVDDLLNVGRQSKIIIPFFLALPISLLNIDTNLWLGFTQVELGPFYKFIIAPVYVMVVANLVNMHSGYNGLATGLVSTLLVFVGAAGYLLNGSESLIFLLPILGALLAFYYYNKYPSQVFDGNCGSLMLGAGLGGLIVLNNLEIFGVIILIPHITNFLMYVVWKIKKVGDVKFGVIRSDGTLEVPNALTMKWVLPYFYRLTEPQTTVILYGLTAFFGVLGLLVKF